MATDAICGNGGEVQNGTFVVAEIASWDLTIERSPSEVAKFGTSRDYLVCNPYSWSGSFSGNWYTDDTNGQKALQTACTGGSTVTLTLSTDGTDDYSGSAYITQVAITTPHDGVVGVSFNFQGSGDLSVPA